MSLHDLHDDSVKSSMTQYFPIKEDLEALNSTLCASKLKFAKIYGLFFSPSLAKRLELKWVDDVDRVFMKPSKNKMQNRENDLQFSEHEIFLLLVISVPKGLDIVGSR